MDLIWFNYSRLFLFTNKTYSQMPFSLDKQLLKQPLLLFFCEQNASSSLGDDQRAVVVEARPSRANRQVHGKKNTLDCNPKPLETRRSYFWLDQLSKNIRWQNDVNLLDDLIILAGFFHHSQRDSHAARLVPGQGESVLFQTALVTGTT